MQGKRRGPTNVDGELKSPGNEALVKRNTSSVSALLSHYLFIYLLNIF